MSVSSIDRSFAHIRWWSLCLFLPDPGLDGLLPLSLLLLGYVAPFVGVILVVSVVRLLAAQLEVDLLRHAASGLLLLTTSGMLRGRGDARVEVSVRLLDEDGV
jgi:hypothetical protein